MVRVRVRVRIRVRVRVRVRIRVRVRVRVRARVADDVAGHLAVPCETLRRERDGYPEDAAVRE